MLIILFIYYPCSEMSISLQHITVMTVILAVISVKG